MSKRCREEYRESSGVKATSNLHPHRTQSVVWSHITTETATSMYRSISWMHEPTRYEKEPPNHKRWIFGPGPGTMRTKCMQDFSDMQNKRASVSVRRKYIVTPTQQGHLITRVSKEGWKEDGTQ
ncbi:hypothetical protein BofuT4_P058690.1 [Botrytis cinerea T4]|uniref:Uncharacterized protein n=1 Tax=Botryotinia fuckeliana (strain T4) TaxID=999810 RepID=G2XUW9_BOTF4|nr:hypothetical protein BofuT4_P058690.1 [Botrytis cinerea T4]